MENAVKSTSNPFKDFFESERNSGIILIFCVFIALIMANSPLQDFYFGILSHKMGVVFDDFVLRKSIEHWINDGLMAVFFLLVGLEIKREITRGELSSFQKASLPIAAAFGGMFIPAAIFLLFNAGEPTVRGWAIPMATDIAFALGILSLLRDRVPNSLRVFLAALAIVDDLGAIIVIAIFYTHQLLWINLLIAAAIVLFLLAMNRMCVRRWGAYIIPGILLWYFVYKSGIHATIAGVLLALTIPSENEDGGSMLEQLEHAIQKSVNYLIMPIFALANTGVIIESHALDGFNTPLSMGIIFGLLAGKCLGVFVFSWFAVRSGLSVLPENARWEHIAGVGFLSGIGFTMSIFISLLSFNSAEFQSIAKISILTASITSGTIGYVILRKIKNGQSVIFTGK